MTQINQMNTDKNGIKSVLISKISEISVQKNENADKWNTDDAD